MFQRDTLLPWCTVEENIGVGLSLSRKPMDDPGAYIRSLIELLGIQGFEKNYPSALSGGMRQRVSIGRLLDYQPDLMLMDEPFGALASLTKLFIASALLRIWEAARQILNFLTTQI